MKKANLLYFNLPESRARKKLRLSFQRQRLTFWRERRLHRSNLTVLIQSVLFWFLLLFAFRVGTIIFFALSGNNNYSGLQLHLPSSHMKSWYSTNKKTIEIWINKEELIAFQDRIMNLETLKKVFREENKNNEVDRVFLYIDKSCPMESVLRLVNSARENGFNEFIFRHQSGIVNLLLTHLWCASHRVHSNSVPNV